MLEYKEIEINDKEWVNNLLALDSRGSLEYNFTTSFIWRNMFNYKITQINDYFVLLADMSTPSYLFPAGSGPLKPVIDALIQDSEERDKRLIFHTILPESKQKLEELYPDKFEFTLQRDNADYVYNSQNLITLAGKKFSGKRNHINRFLENYPDWQFEVITEENFKEVTEMNEEWCKQVDCNKNESLKKEICAVKQAFKHFFELKLDGGLLRAGGKVVAFSLGDALNEETYLVHIEKAFADVQGAYPMINKHFASHYCKDYLYINREDDAGEEGLRKAKLSYKPVRLVEKYSAKYIK